MWRIIERAARWLFRLDVNERKEKRADFDSVAVQWGNFAGSVMNRLQTVEEQLRLTQTLQVQTLATLADCERERVKLIMRVETLEKVNGVKPSPATMPRDQ